MVLVWAECGMFWKLGEEEEILLGGFAVLAAGEDWCDFFSLSSLVLQSEEGSLWTTTVPDTTLKPCKLQRRRMKPKLQR